MANDLSNRSEIHIRRPGNVEQKEKNELDIFQQKNDERHKTNRSAEKNRS